MNNNNNHVIKQINRVATPIKVDQNGNRIEEPVTQPNNTFENVKMSDVNTVNTQTKEHDPSTMIFITVMLLIFACATAYICYILLVREDEYQTSKYGYNDTKVISDRVGSVKVNKVILNNGVNIIGEYENSVNNFFNINKNSNNDITVNDKYICTNEILFSKFIVVGDNLVFGVKDIAERTTMIYIVDEEGNIVNKYYNLDDENGMVLGDTSNTFDVVSNEVVLYFSRVSGTKVFNSIEYGSTEYLNICDVDNTFNASLNLELIYQGNNKFKENKTDIITVGTYKGNNYLCR